MRIALWQPPAPFTDRESLLSGIDRLLARAAAADCRLLLAPERLLAGPEGASPEAVAEPSDGPLARALAARCREHRIGLALGYLERFAGRLFSSLMVFSPAGLALGNYRRTHLREGEERALTAGNWLTLVPFEGRRLGLLAGADLELPEPARALALAGAEALLTVADAAVAEPAMLRSLLASRAFENRLPVVHAGYAPPGGSGVAAFTAAGMAAEVAICGPLQIVALDRGAGPAGGPRRRPELYAGLTEIDA